MFQSMFTRATVDQASIEPITFDMGTEIDPNAHPLSPATAAKISGPFVPSGPRPRVQTPRKANGSYILRRGDQRRAPHTCARTVRPALITDGHQKAGLSVLRVNLAPAPLQQDRHGTSLGLSQ
ncbi:hypothetical protein AcW2_000027 [Taiwanofungus camphoratus]|nr:hypothetical protein AcW2_000027 [Antrodia cinnamomea]